MDAFERGFVTIGRWRGAPIRLHWSAPIVAFVMGRFELVPAFWAAFFLLVLIHELGHAQVVRWAKCEVESIDVHGLGGWCRWSGSATALERACIAWGGVWAQLLLLGATLGVLAFVEPSTAAGLQLADAFTRTNLWLIALNLIPIPPLDGAEAWKLGPILWPRLLAWWGRRSYGPVKREIERGLRPDDRPVSAPKTEQELEGEAKELLHRLDRDIRATLADERRRSEKPEK